MLVKYLHAYGVILRSLILVALLLAAPGEARPAGEVCAPKLRNQLWSVLAFLPPDNAQSPKTRQLELPATHDRPGLTMRATFQDPKDPWPHSLRLEVTPLKGEAWWLEDSRPFGTGNLRSSYISLEAGRESPGLEVQAAFFSELAERLREQKPLLNDIVWQEMAAGLWRARAASMMGVRVGSPELILIKFDPALYQLTPFHESEFSPPVSYNIAQWAAGLPGRPVLLAGGQYYPDRSYMGLFKKDHNYLFALNHPKWQGYLASGPTGNKADLGVLVVDGQYEDYRRWALAYPHMLQTFVLLDKLGHKRVVDSENLASRLALAQDEDGFIIIIALPDGAITLSDLSFVLQTSPLNLKTVLGLDGGFEAQLAFMDSSGLTIVTGTYSQDKTLNRVWSARGYRPSLPAILALEPLTGPVSAGAGEH